MHLLYVDDSGHPDDPNLDWLVLAGVSFFERQGYWIASELDQIAARFNSADPDAVELHGAAMRNGREWRTFAPAERVKAITDSLRVLAESHPSNRVFAVAVKKGCVSPKDPVEYAFEQISSRFDQYLRRLHLQGDTQRGLMIFDRKDGERRIQELASEFRRVGHTWGVLKNLAEVPVFMDSRASRLLQLADLVAYSVFRRLQNEDTSFFSVIEERFDQSSGVVHGLHVADGRGIVAR
jgi:hypothetical protein